MNAMNPQSALTTAPRIIVIGSSCAGKRAARGRVGPTLLRTRRAVLGTELDAQTESTVLWAGRICDGAIGLGDRRRLRLGKNPVLASGNDDCLAQLGVRDRAIPRNQTNRATHVQPRTTLARQSRVLWPLVLFQGIDPGLGRRDLHSSRKVCFLIPPKRNISPITWINVRFGSLWTFS